ncbi:hypothetical protein JTE90_027575 [Oedothorax gibbosus]|uniref:Shavenoid isoform B-like N-terminal domain-containing protein n=1 Tax=Oedothorax gibbosus TaxID=931172 RepID=A0AAV6VMA1_9ARAC|nr:hypothetical protein JTE90_027575 [Oedothorax gibbosus]
MLSIYVIILFLVSSSGGNDVTRDFFGDIFKLRDCHNGSRCDNGGKRPAMEIPGRPCYCQCAPTHLAYREDKQQCVKDIKECYMSVFYRPFTVEAIPLVYLPTSGQLVHPDAHLSLAGRRNAEAGFPTCKAAVSQYLTKDGWRTLTRVDGGGPVFGLFEDSNKTFLQFLGNSQDRRVLQQHLAMIRLFCRIPQFSPFETCVAIRVGWVPGVDNLDNNGSTTNKANMMVVGLSLGVLGLVYVFAVVVYLKIRRQQMAKRKSNSDQEACIEPIEDDPENTSRRSSIETSKRLELYHTSTLGRKQSSNDPWSQMNSLVETYNRTWTDRMGQPGCEFRAQDFQIQPEFFEPEFMASPPQQVLEYLERLQNSVTFARHRLRSCYRYQPTLIGIPEDDYFYQELEKVSPSKEARTTPDGGSASSMASLLEIAEDQDDVTKTDAPRIPPRKPKRKSTSKTKVEINHDVLKSSEQEQKEIQNAMNTLNETLDALEYDIYKHDLMHQISDAEQTQPNSTEGELDDFDSSSCSSMSAVTVLGKEVKKHFDINSTGSRSVEKNLSEEFSTFRNSTFSVGTVMPGLFTRKNVNCKASNQSDSSDSSSQSGDSVKSSKCTPISKNVKGISHKISLERKMKNINNPCAESVKKPKCTPISKNVKELSDKISPEKMGNVNNPPNKCHDLKLPVPHEEIDSKVEPKRHLLHKSSSTESMTTTATDMTTDSLESRSSSPNPQRISLSPTPSLVDMWINKLIQNSVPYSKSRRKSKKKQVLPESEADGWEHVCQKQQQQKDSCPMHDLNNTEPNLIDKLAHYSSKTMAGQNVAGYFQSLKQDVLKEHLKAWLISNSQIKRHRNGITVKYRNKEYSHKKPLVSNGPDTSSACEASATWENVNQNVKSATEKESKIHDSIEPVSFVSVSELVDSLESQNSARVCSEDFRKSKSNSRN